MPGYLPLREGQLKQASVVFALILLRFLYHTFFVSIKPETESCLLVDCLSSWPEAERCQVGSRQVLGELQETSQPLVGKVRRPIVCGKINPRKKKQGAARNRLGARKGKLP